MGRRLAYAPSCQVLNFGIVASDQGFLLGARPSLDLALNGNS
jgi:hypothetical protein